MQRLMQISLISALFFFSALFVGPVSMLGQPAANDQATLTLKQVKEQLKQNKKYLKEAKSRVKSGDTAGLETALNNYDRSMEGLNTALSQGHFDGSPSQQEDAYNRVQTATSKHLDVLNGLLSKVPSQAVAHIQHAIDVSKTGQTTALSHLSQLQTQQGFGQGNRPGFGQAGGMGRSQGGERSGGMGGFGAGNAPMGGAGMGGAMGHPGGGPPSGRPGR